MNQESSAPWQATACIICSLNCGIEVQTEGKKIIRVRADKNHPVSRGYVCEKAQRMDHYQNTSDRLSSPMRRRADGSYEAITWDTAISDIAAKLADIKKTHGGESIFYYGGGNQGNHLGATYADSTLRALGVRYRSNALAQEKTGEAWVQGRMMGTAMHGDFDHAEVAVFIGKNPWHSHGFARARLILKDIHKDPNRSLVVIDPRKSETAELADYHLMIQPGTDAWCLAAMVGVVVQENLVAQSWLEQHTTGYEQVIALFRNIDVAHYAKLCGVDEDLLRQATRRIGRAKSASFYEDLGMQMNLHSTLGSYLNRLLWLLTGHFGREGTNNAFVPLLSLSTSERQKQPNAGGKNEPSPWKKSPVTGSRVVMGLIPCNVIPEEILTDHPRRFRAMIVESTNPVHSLADSAKMREAIRSLQLSVVIDIAMTETAMQADYVLPAATAFEKAEATFYNTEIKANGFHLRHRLFAPKENALTEAEIHARLVEKITGMGEKDYRWLKAIAKMGLTAFAVAFVAASGRNKNIARYPAVVLYRTLGVALTPALATAASLWGIAHNYVRQQKKSAAGAGFGGNPLFAGNRLFKAIVSEKSGFIFGRKDYADSWRFIRHPGNKINLWLEDFVPAIAALEQGPPPPRLDYPLFLSAGERRSETSNTTIRNSDWHKKGLFGALRISPEDAQRLGFEHGQWVRLCTPRGAAEVPLDISASMRSGHISLPNGLGLDCHSENGTLIRRGVSVNELTDCLDRDPFVGTPWHKRVPARIERIERTEAA